MLSAVRLGVLDWAVEVAVLLDACRQLVEYYGSDEEEDSFRRAVETPLWLVEAIKKLASDEDVDLNARPTSSAFTCSESRAEILTPLIRLVVEWQPAFIDDARQAMVEDDWKQLSVTYGLFVGTVARCLCDPMWSKYPRLAPPGWPG
ncbi:MAG: hypothetical protein JST00_11835 [Deltaproteobacteria bacterium]|nr:hypothetical protein [Deltaproteobacteria bacterium]